MLGLVLVGCVIGYAGAGVALAMSHSWLIALATLSLGGTGSILLLALLRTLISREDAAAQEIPAHA